MIQHVKLLWTSICVFVTIWYPTKCYECICYDDVLNRPAIFGELPTSSKPVVIGFAFPGDCFFYNGTTSFKNKTFWKTDLKGKEGWFDGSDIRGLNIVSCSNPLRDIKEGADCLYLMKREGFYKSPTDIDYWMTFGPCRNSADCPLLKSNDVITVNNKTWYNVADPRFNQNGYMSTENSFKWRCEKVVSVKGDNFPTWKIAAITTVVFLIVIVIPSALVFIWKRKSGFKLKIEDNEQFEGTDKHFQEEYDVFVSYSREDWEWVRKTLFEKLRHEGYSVCIDFKDFIPGMDVSDNIMSCIYKSRKTIIVMSKNFLKSMWGQFELHHAHYRGIWQRKDTLILIKFGKCKVPTRLMGKTFLDWTCKPEKAYFWKRLFESIGKPISDGSSKKQIKHEMHEKT